MPGSQPFVEERGFVAELVSVGHALIGLARTLTPGRALTSPMPNGAPAAIAASPPACRNSRRLANEVGRRHVSLFRVVTRLGVRIYTVAEAARSIELISMTVGRIFCASSLEMAELRRHSKDADACKGRIECRASPHKFRRVYASSSSSILVVAAVALTAVLGSTIRAQNTAKSYIIVATSQNAAATEAIAALAGSRGTVTAQLSDIGVVGATSSDPDFAAAMAADALVQSVGEDPEIQWLPDERSVDAGELALPVANAETFSAIQWNLRAIHADQTAANGDRGNTAVRARVAVLDSGIVTNHVDIAPNLNLPLSVSFVPGEGLNPPNFVFNHGTHVAGIARRPWERHRHAGGRAGRGGGCRQSAARQRQRIVPLGASGN